MRHQVAIATTLLCLVTLSAVAAPTAPFNAQNATQVFQMSQSGGIQQVTANNPNDKQLVAVIRTYLESEADRFGSGDYSGPMKLAGKDVPAAQYLKAVTSGQMAITYRNVAGGAAIDYVGKDKATVDAIHNWFDALLSDGDDD